MVPLVAVALQDRIFDHEAFRTDPFLNFSPLHFQSILGSVALVAVLLLLVVRTKERARRRFEFILAAVMLLGTILQIAWSALSGYFDPGRDLVVFHMCGLFNLVAVVLLLLRKRSPFLQNALYFAGLPGAVMAIATPDLQYAFPHFMYFLFFLSHSLIVYAALHFLVYRGFRPAPRAIPKVFLFLNLVLVPVYLMDKLTNGNYFFLLRPPENTLAIVFANWVGWNWYLIPMEIVALLLFGLLALPWIRWRRQATAPAGGSPAVEEGEPENR